MRGITEEGRTECRKTLMEQNPPIESTRAQAMRKTRQVPTKLKTKRKPQEKRRKREEEEDEKIDAGHPAEQERQTRG